MRSVLYNEETFELDLDEGDIATCTDEQVLIGWRTDLDVVIADINGQVEVQALARNIDPAWVYRCSKASGLFRRARARIDARMKLFGWGLPFHHAETNDLQRKLAEAKARSEVAVEFLRICQEGGLPDRGLFGRLETQAVRLVDERRAKKVAKLEAAQ